MADSASNHSVDPNDPAFAASKRFDYYFAAVNSHAFRKLLVNSDGIADDAGNISQSNIMDRFSKPQGLRIRILTGFSLVIVLSLFIAGWSYYHITTLGNAAEHLFVENYRSIKYATTMEQSAKKIAEGKSLESADSTFRASLRLAEQNLTEKGEDAYVGKLRITYASFWQAAREHAPHEAIANYALAIDSAANNLAQLNERAMFARSDAIKERASFARTSSIAITLLLCVTSIFLAIAVSRRSLAEFRELDRAKSNFVATAAHELKNPISSMRTMIGMLLDGITGPITTTQRETVSRMQAESDRLLRLVRELLDLARLETGMLPLSVEPSRVDALIESATMPVMMQAASAQVEIDVRVPHDLAEVELDQNKIAWAITNLLANAIRYSPRGAHVEVLARATDDELLISVRDRGKGIDAKDKARIFDKFVQVEDGRMGVGSGSGLGLSIAKEIVQAHAGRIWVESEQGSGATFWIALPLVSRLKHQRVKVKT